MATFYNRIFIFFTYHTFIVNFIVFFFFNVSLNVVYAENEIFGDIRLNDPTLPKPHLFPNVDLSVNPLLKGVYTCYSQDQWNIEKEIQRLELVLYNNRPDPREVFLLRGENLRFNLVEPKMIDMLSYHNSYAIAQLWDDCVFDRLKVNSEETKSLLCYLSIVEKGYIYVPSLTTRPVLYDDLYQHINNFFPSPNGPQASKYYTNLEGSPNLSYIKTNESIYNLWLTSKKNPLLSQTLVIINQNTALYTHYLLHPNTVISAIAKKEMYFSLLQAFLEKNVN